MGPLLGFGNKSIAHERNDPIASEFEMGRGGGRGAGRGGGELLLFTFLLYIAVVSEGEASYGRLIMSK